MNYIGYFRNLYDNQQYTVRIKTDFGSNIYTEIQLGENPFTTSYEGGEVLFKPLKMSSATINVVHNNYLFDIYNPTAQGTRIELLDGNNDVVWTGYLTPNLYSQSYENEFESFDLEAIDALSTLEYFKYEPVSTTLGICSLQSVLVHCIEKCNAYTDIYLAATNKTTQESTELNLLKNVVVSEYNFIGEDEDQTFTYKEVLFEICQMFGLTCIADGSKVYFLDYDAIKNGLNTYIHLASSTGFNVSEIVSLTQMKTITASDYRGNGSTLSLANVYNKISVSNNKFNIDNILPDLFIESNLTNAVNPDLPYYFYLRIFGNTSYAYRTYMDKNWINTYYTKDGNWTPTSVDVVDYTALQTYIGASFIQMTSFDMNKGAQGSISFSNYICFHRHLEADPSSSNNVAKPVLTLNTNNRKPMILGSNCYLVVSGSAMWTDREGRICPILDGRDDDNFSASNLYLTAKLKLGNKFWNGTIWSTTDTTFKIFFDDADTSHFIGKWTAIKDNLNPLNGVNASGYGIPITEADCLSGTPEFTLYTPKCVDSGYRTDSVWIKDIKIEVETKDIWNDSDTLYTNVVDEDYVNEFSGIQTRVSSFDNKDMSYSLLGFSSNGVISKFGEYWSESLGISSLKPEQMLCYRYYNQYNTPSKILELTLKNDIKPYCRIIENNLNAVFVVDSMSIDYANQTNSIKLVEKK